MNTGSLYYFAFISLCAVVFELFDYLLLYALFWGVGLFRELVHGIVAGTPVRAIKQTLRPLKIAIGIEAVAVLRIVTVFISMLLSCYVFLDGRVRVSHVLFALCLILVLPALTKTRVFQRIIDLCFIGVKILCVAAIFPPYILLHFLCRTARIASAKIEKCKKRRKMLKIDAES